ncbi:11507_t:CDS:1 [Ambispora leptoticha]|uniref:11507_t:CDS:1 n=1 Tax=Ambispora leptoticha TaxID=144679 RepID=A0A9N9A9J3_9GLOM|nr:11507_t:CDS:1 [Ambispora leptoticha]
MAANLIGAVIVGISITLTSHSYLRLKLLKTNGHEIMLLNIANIFTLANEIAILTLCYASQGFLSSEMVPCLSFLSNLAYCITKPAMIYLAYLRVSYIYKKYRQYCIYHYWLLVCRIITMVVLLSSELALYLECKEINNESSTKCQKLNVFWKIVAIFDSLWQIYYIVSETIFFYHLMTQLKNINKDANTKIIRYTHFQTILFFIDILQLIAIGIYKCKFLLKASFPSFFYFEILSCAFTVYNISQFGIRIPRSFRDSPYKDGEVSPVPVKYQDSPKYDIYLSHLNDNQLDTETDSFVYNSMGNTHGPLDEQHHSNFSEGNNSNNSDSLAIQTPSRAKTKDDRDDKNCIEFAYCYTDDDENINLTSASRSNI